MEDRRGRQVRAGFRAFEHAVRARTARMDDTFGNAFMVEMEYLFAQDKIFEQRRSALSGTQAVLIVRNAAAEIGGQVPGPNPVICLDGDARPEGGREGKEWVSTGR